VDRHDETVDTKVHLYLTDFPIDDAEVTKVLVTFTHVEVYSAAIGDWLTVVDYGSQGRTLDLLMLQNGRTEELGAFQLDPGAYDQIRLHLQADNEIEVDRGGGPVIEPLTVPSGDETGIKLVRPFTVTGEGPTAITVDFDAKASVSFNRGQGFMLKPTIKIIGSSTNATATRLVGADGATVRLLNEAEVTIPPGALAKETEISINVVEFPADVCARMGVLPSSIVELGPHGTSFAKPVTVKLYYNVNELPAGASPEDLTLLAEVNGYWTEVLGQIDPVLGTVTAEVSHFSRYAVGPQIRRIEKTAVQPVRPGHTQIVQVLLFDAYNQEVESRDVAWESKDTTFMRVSLPPRGCTATNQATCDANAYCSWNGVSCLDDHRFANVEGWRYPGASLKVSIPNGTASLDDFFIPVTPRLRVTFTGMHVWDDGDTGEGELYWFLLVNERLVENHPQARDTNDGDNIPLSSSAVFDLPYTGGSLTIRADIREDDGGLNGGTDSSGFVQSYGESSTFGEGYRQGRTHGSPDVTVNYVIQLCVTPSC
jgi:hypothetical protein